MVELKDVQQDVHAHTQPRIRLQHVSKRLGREFDYSIKDGPESTKREKERNESSDFSKVEENHHVWFALGLMKPLGSLWIVEATAQETEILGTWGG